MRQKFEAEIKKLSGTNKPANELDYVDRIITALLKHHKSPTLLITTASQTKGDESPSTPRSLAARTDRLMQRSPASPRSGLPKLDFNSSPLSGSLSVDLSDAIGGGASPRAIQFMTTPRVSKNAPNLMELLGAGFDYFNAKEIIFDLAFNAVFGNQNNPISEQALAKAFRNLQLTLSVIPEINKKLQPILDFYFAKSSDKPRAELAKLILFLLAIYLIAKGQLKIKDETLPALSAMLFGCLPFEDVLSNLTELQQNFARFHIDELEKKCLFMALGDSAEFKQQEILQQITLLDHEHLRQGLTFGIISESDRVQEISLSLSSQEELDEASTTSTTASSTAGNVIVITYDETISAATLESTAARLTATNPESKLLIVYLQSAATDHPDATAIASLAEAKKAMQFTYTPETTVQEFKEQILRVSNSMNKTLMAKALCTLSALWTSASTALAAGGAAEDPSSTVTHGNSPSSS